MLILLEQKKEFKEIWILDVMHMFAYSWRNVTAAAISNCFRKAGFVQKSVLVQVMMKAFHYTKGQTTAKIKMDKNEWSSTSQDSLSLFFFLQDFVSVNENNSNKRY